MRRAIPPSSVESVNSASVRLSAVRRPGSRALFAFKLSKYELSDLAMTVPSASINSISESSEYVVRSTSNHTSVPASAVKLYMS